MMVLDAQKILVVDDDMLILLALERAYRNRHLDITTAASADHALSLLNSTRFDLFVVDLDLDNRSGFQLLQTLDERFPYIPIILNTAADITSNELSQEITRIRKKGVWHLLEKPFSLDLLNGMIEKFLDQQDNRLTLNLNQSHTHGEEQRSYRRKAHIMPTNLSFDAICAGELIRETVKVILTDVSDCGVGLLTNRPLEKSQVVRFDDALGQKCGVVAWSMVVSDLTCRAGVQFC
jgi:CheY-like chemotaxis protein